MAAKFPPESLPIIQPSNIPLIRIDGLESCFLQDGWVFSRYYVIEPVMDPGGDLSIFRPLVRRLCLSLICSQENQLRMRGQAATILPDHSLKARNSRVLTA